MGAASTPRSGKIPGAIRIALAQNLSALMTQQYVSLPNETARIMALAKDSKVGHGTIQRILKQESGGTIDTIERLALALEVSVYQLLLPNLDAKNPQTVKGATAEEQRLYAQFKKASLGLSVHHL